MVEARVYRAWRVQRLKELIAESGGPKALSEKCNMNSDTHLIACSKGRRAIGDDLATALELGANKPHGWMDTDPALDKQPKLTPRAIELAQMIDGLPVADREKMFRVLDALQPPGPG